MHSFEYFYIPYHLKIYLIINRSSPYYFFMYVFMSQNGVSTLNRRATRVTSKLLEHNYRQNLL